MNKRAQVLMISLWILVILAMLAVGVGHRVSMALYLSRYQKDRLGAFCLAKAGISRMISEIENDSSDCDALNEKWSGDEELFKRIAFNDNSDEFSTVSYTVTEDDRENTIFGAVDEERKININTASKELLIALLEDIGVTDASGITDNICAWRREDAGVSIPNYGGLGYPNKSSKFSNIEELILVKDVTPEIFNSVRDLVTVYGSGKININTAPQRVLGILINSCVKKLAEEGVEDREPQDLVNKIIQLRQAGIIFATLPDLQAKLTSLTSAQINILNKFLQETDIKSTCFYIVSNGKINTRNYGYSIGCIFDRSNKKIIYWHES